MTNEQQRAYVIENYLVKSYGQICRDIGRSRGFIMSTLKRNGLKRPKAISEKFSKESHYRKGRIPKNKGLKITDYMSPEQIERTKKGRFQKGHRPHNTKERNDVTIRNHKDRPYIYVKIGDNYHELYHRLMWEDANGTIPHGYNIQFKDGNSLNVKLDNLYMISKKEQAIINKRGGNKIPFDYQKTVLLITEIKKRINEKQNNRP